MMGRRFAMLANAFAEVARGKAGISLPFCICIDFLTNRLFRKNWMFVLRSRKRFEPRLIERYSALYKREDNFDFDGIKLPLMDKNYESLLLGPIYPETIFPHTEMGDRFPEEMHIKYDRVFYGFQGRGLDATVAPGDVVIDIGSWVGDFAAYSSMKGASKIYAFEPTPMTYGYLCRTAELNENIEPVQLGLGEEPGELTMHLYDDVNTGGNSFIGERGAEIGTIEKLPITTLDTFVEERGIERVDFIKADIEGFERHMLKGAVEVMRKFAPKLAICTYHLPDDPQVLEQIIRDAQPAYTIVQMPHILFAQKRDMV